MVGVDLPAVDGEVVSVAEAAAPRSVTLRLADDIDVARGDLIASPTNEPTVCRALTGPVAVLSDRPLRVRDRVLARVGTRTVRGIVESIDDELDITTMTHLPTGDSLGLNAIGRVTVRLAEPVALDDYRRLRHTGAFLLIDEVDGTTLAAGMAQE